MDKEDNKILTIIKSKSFLKIFCIPISIWLLFALITLAYPNEPERSNLVGFFGSTVFVLVIWFAISFFIAKMHKKEKTKNIKKKRKNGKK